VGDSLHRVVGVPEPQRGEVHPPPPGQVAARRLAGDGEEAPRQGGARHRHLGRERLGRPRPAGRLVQPAEPAPTAAWAATSRASWSSAAPARSTRPLGPPRWSTCPVSRCCSSTAPTRHRWPRRPPSPPTSRPRQTTPASRPPPTSSPATSPTSAGRWRPTTSGRSTSYAPSRPSSRPTAVGPSPTCCRRCHGPRPPRRASRSARGDGRRPPRVRRHGRPPRRGKPRARQRRPVPAHAPHPRVPLRPERFGVAPSGSNVLDGA